MLKTPTEELIAGDEGYREFPYRCPAGKMTIGYGYNLDAGMPEDEAHVLLRYRLGKLRARCESLFPWFCRMNDARRRVILSMVYQLGVEGLLGFRNTLAALARDDYTEAAAHMLDSKWAHHDSPDRARRLAEMMRHG